MAPKRCWLLLMGLVVTLQACSGGIAARFPAVVERPAEAEAFYRELDQAVAAAGVQNAATTPVPGFPYLRSNRFLAEICTRLTTSGQETAWHLQMMGLDLDARRREIRNLPSVARSALASHWTIPDQPQEWASLLRSRAEALYDADRRQPGFAEAVRQSVVVPSEYSTAMRVAGLYPLFRLPVAWITQRVRNEFQAWFDTPESDLPVQGELTIFRPPPTPSSRTQWFAGTARDPLGLLPLSGAASRQLALAYAPVWRQDIAADYDRPGKVVWEGDRVTVVPRIPTVYYYLSHTLLQGRPLRQLNYVLWYSGRRGPQAPWIERGHLDGLTVRITFNADGNPIMVDGMNNCGCYHFFAPRRETLTRIQSPAWQLDPFVPQFMPADFPRMRLALRINSGWHQVQRLTTALDSAHSPVRTYELRPYFELESLPLPSGEFASMFDKAGIAKGSDRIEPLLLFPMGIPKVGSMRQRGHHALELVGRAHFDDPDLFERRFVFKQAETGLSGALPNGGQPR